MKIYKALLLVALLGVLITSCTKSDVQPTSAKAAATTNTSQDTIYAYSPAISGPIGATIPDSTLAGNWTLVSDSTSFSHGESAAFDSGKKYTGQPGDYFNIASDGNINFKEGSNSQSISCVLINSATNSFQLLYTQYPNAAVVGGGFIHAQLLKPVVTANSAILASEIFTPGGIFYRQFTLKK